MKKNNAKRKALTIFALVAMLLVLHAFVSSNTTMAEHVFANGSDNVVTELSQTESSHSMGQELVSGIENFFALPDSEMPPEVILS